MNRTFSYRSIDNLGLSDDNQYVLFDIMERISNLKNNRLFDEAKADNKIIKIGSKRTHSFMQAGISNTSRKPF